MLYSFIVNVKPGSTASESDLVVALQFILQTEFEDSVNRAKFNRLSRDVFSHLGESMSCDWSNVKDGDEEVTKLVVGLGGSMLQLTQLFYETRLVSASLPRIHKNYVCRRALTLSLDRLRGPQHY